MDVESHPIAKVVELGIQESRHALLLVAICADPGGSTKDYAERLNLTKPVISRGCSFLVERGYVQSRINGEDRRHVILTPTERGKRACAFIDGETVNGPAAPAKPFRPGRPPGRRAVNPRSAGRA